MILKIFTIRVINYVEFLNKKYLLNKQKIRNVLSLAQNQGIFDKFE